MIQHVFGHDRVIVTIVSVHEYVHARRKIVRTFAITIKLSPQIIRPKFYQVGPT